MELWHRDGIYLTNYGLHVIINTSNFAYNFLLCCQTAHCVRSKPHFDFGELAFPIVPYRHQPHFWSFFNHADHIISNLFYSMKRTLRRKPAVEENIFRRDYRLFSSFQKRKHGGGSFLHGQFPAFVSNGSFVHICSFINSIFLVFCRKKNAVYRQKCTSI